MRRSSIFLLLGAVLLGLLAVAGVKAMMGQRTTSAKAAPQTYVVVAAQPLKFGAKIEAASLKSIPWPGALPEGAFDKVSAAVADGSRTALRAFGAGEPLLATAISGELGRLASSSQLGAEMRAIAIPVDEYSGAGGFVAPGDRVDILVTRKASDDAASVGLVAQGLRVLATGQMQDPAQTEPRVVKSVTLEVTPEEAQRIALAQTIGGLSLALRPTGDEARLPLRALNTAEAFGIRPAARDRDADGAVASAGAASGARRRSGPEVSIVRGTEATSYALAR